MAGSEELVHGAQRHPIRNRDGLTIAGSYWKRSACTGPIARGEIARKVGPTVQTVSSIIRELELQDFMIGAREVPKGRGYPATAVTLNPEGGFAIGTNVSPIGIIIGQQGRRSCNQLRNLQVRLLATMHTPRGIHRHIFPAWRSPETAVGRSSKGVYSTGLMNEFLWITWSGSILGHLDSQPAQEVVKWRGALRTS